MWTFSSNFLFVFVSLFGTQYTRSRQFTKRPTLTSSNSLEYKFFCNQGQGGQGRMDWTKKIRRKFDFLWISVVGRSESDTFIIVLIIYTFHSTPWQNNSENIQQQKFKNSNYFLNSAWRKDLCFFYQLCWAVGWPVPGWRQRWGAGFQGPAPPQSRTCCSDGTCNYQLFRWDLQLSAVQEGPATISCSGRAYTYLLFRRDLQLSAVQVGPALICCSGGTCNYQLFRWDLQLSAVRAGPATISCSGGTCNFQLFKMADIS